MIRSYFESQTQQEQVHAIQTRLPTLSETLARVGSAEAECLAANVEENDYTLFTCQDLEFELELVRQSIAKKIAFINNQVGPAILSPFRRLTALFYRSSHAI